MSTKLNQHHAASLLWHILVRTRLPLHMWIWLRVSTQTLEAGTTHVTKMQPWAGACGGVQPSVAVVVYSLLPRFPWDDACCAVVPVH